MPQGTRAKQEYRQVVERRLRELYKKYGQDEMFLPLQTLHPADRARVFKDTAKAVEAIEQIWRSGGTSKQWGTYEWLEENQQGGMAIAVLGSVIFQLGLVTAATFVGAPVGSAMMLLGGTLAAVGGIHTIGAEYILRRADPNRAKEMFDQWQGDIHPALRTGVGGAQWGGERTP